MNLIIECDGNYWHNYPFGNDRDKIRTTELIAQGFKVLRLWEHEIKQMDLNKFKEAIKLC
jgi:very-short-patch-repair endonuclease